MKAKTGIGIGLAILLAIAFVLWLSAWQLAMVGNGQASVLLRVNKLTGQTKVVAQFSPQSVPGAAGARGPQTTTPPLRNAAPLSAGR